MKTKKIVAILFLAILLFTPLIFLTNKTKNPFLVQSVFLNFGIALILLIVLIRSCLKGVVFPRSPFDRFWVGWLALAVVSFLVALFQNQGRTTAIMVMGLQNIVFLALNCLAVYYLAFVLSPRKDFLRAAVYVLITVAIIACSYGLVQYFGFEPLWPKQVQYFEGRIVSTFGNPAFLASFLVMIIPLVAALWLNAKTKASKVILSLLFLLVFTTLLATSARSALAGLAVAFLIFILYLYKLGYRREIKVLSVSLLALVILAGSIVYFSSQKDLLRSRIEGVIKPQALGTSLQQRFLIWCCSLEMFYQHPFTGQGWGLFELFYPYYQFSYLKNPAFASYRTHANHAHNELLQIAAELGTAGILLSLYFISLLTRQAKRLLTSKITREQQLIALGIFSGIIGLIVDSMFNVSFHITAPAMVFWCLAGLLSGFNTITVTGQPAVSGFWRFGALLLIPVIFLVAGLSILQLAAAAHHFTGINYVAASEKMTSAEQPQKSSLLALGEKELVQSLQLFPWNKEVAYDLGCIYFRLGEKDQAIAAYTRAIELDFSYEEMFYMLGVSLLQGGRTVEAEKSLRQALTLNPSSEPVKAALAGFVK